MGGNQAMQDTADMLPPIKLLAQMAKIGNLKQKDFSLAVNDYETKMLPRAFNWVRRSGGIGSSVRYTTFVSKQAFST
jgi:hypothetical protein